MGKIENLSNLIFLMTDGTSQQIFDYKEGRVAGVAASAHVAGRFHSLWQYDGSRSFGSVASASGENSTNATDGTLKQTDPTSGKQLWLLSLTAGASAQGTLVLYDRLAAESGNSGTVTSAQSLTGCIVNRYTGTEAAGNQIWLEITTIIGTTATTVTVSYTNQAGTAGRTSQAVAFGGTGLREAQRLIPLVLQQGDTGVRSVESVTVLATTGTAGDFTVLIARPIAYLPQTAVGQGVMRDMISGIPGAVEIKTDAALAWGFWANSTAIPQTFAHAVFVEK
jgi:hypothetical protein